MDLNDFNLIMETKNPGKKLAFQWSIKGIKKLPGAIKSNKFALVSGKPQDWYMAISLSTPKQFHVSLTHDGSIPVRVHHVARVLKNDGAVYVGYTPSSNVYSTDEPFVLLSDVKLPAYEEDKLTVECSMTVYGYNLDTTFDLFDDDSAPDLDIDDVKSCYRRMLMDKFTDVKIVIGKKYYNAHRCILKFRAPIFYKSYLDEISRGKVVLQDIEPHIFRIVLEYIYSMTTYEIQISNHCSEVYQAAIFFGLKGLKEICLKEIVFDTRTGNVCDYYRLGDKHKDKELLKHCMLFMRENMSLLQSDSKWLSLRQSKPNLQHEIVNGIDNSGNEIVLKESHF